MVLWVWWLFQICRLEQFYQHDVYNLWVCSVHYDLKPTQRQEYPDLKMLHTIQTFIVIQNKKKDLKKWFPNKNTLFSIEQHSSLWKCYLFSFTTNKLRHFLPKKVVCMCGRTVILCMSQQWFCNFLLIDTNTAVTILVYEKNSSSYYLVQIIHFSV